LRLNGCDGAVTNSTISDNFETGVVLTGSNLRFTGNTLSGNRVGIQIDDNLPALWANTISGNSGYNLMFLGEETLFAGGNDLVDKVTGESETKIFSKRPGAVQFTPIFTPEPAQSPK
jgi:parallel beta-helix repeat protein